jgi:Asp-tRNA(Asn)/Glu-tRNA(Gln) amidotransferase B subunit
MPLPTRSSARARCLEKGEPIVLHTRLWDPDKRVTAPMRGKFEGPCVPDPAVASIVVTDTWLDAQIRQQPAGDAGPKSSPLDGRLWPDPG